LTGKPLNISGEDVETKQYKAKGGEILDAEDGKQIGVFLPTHCSKRLRDRIVKCAVENLNSATSAEKRAEQAEKRAEQAEKDLAAAMVEVAEILHNRQAKIEALKQAERDAVRECEKVVSRLDGSLEDYGYAWGYALEAASDAIKERFPKHFEG